MSLPDAVELPRRTPNSVSMLLPVNGGERKRPAWAIAAACPHLTQTKGHLVSDNSTPPATLESEGASNVTPKSYEIAPGDRDLADSLVNQDPIRDLSGPVSVVGAVKLPEKITREMLPTDVRARVDARLADFPEVNRAAAEESIILEEAEKYAYAVRVWGGPGLNANAYQEERFTIEHEIFDAQRKLSERLTALQEIVRHDRKVDESTGEEFDEPVFRLRGSARSAAEFEASDLRQRIALLEGSEGQRRLRKAEWQAVQDAKKLQEEAAIDREAQEQAKADVRAARVADRANAYRKFEETER